MRFGLVVALSSIAAVASAQSPAGGEFQVNTYTTADQSGKAIAIDAAGNFVVVWHSAAQDGSGFGVYGRRYDASGSPRGPEFRVNAYTTGDQRAPAVASDRAGRFVVAWQSAGQDGSGNGIFARRYDASGAPASGEFQVNSFTAGDQTLPALASDAAGDFVAAWTSAGQDGSAEGVFARRFAVWGGPRGGEFQVNAYTPGAQRDGALASDGAGNFVVVWTSDGQDGSLTGIFGQRFDASGSHRGAEFRVNAYTPQFQDEPSVASDGAGNFVVAWSRWQYTPPIPPVFPRQIAAQRYSAGGSPLGGEFQADTYGVWGYPASPAVATDRAGNFAVTWQSLSDGSRNGVYARRYDSGGGARTGAFLANTYTHDSQWQPGIASDPSGNLVVVWESCQSPLFPPGQDGDGCGIFAQRFGGIMPAALAVDTAPSGGTDGNGVIEAGESTDVRPSWRNLNGAAQLLDGTVLRFEGPSGAGVGYVLLDGTGTYGLVANGATAPCSNCYGARVSLAGPRPAVHWDATFTERLVPDAQGQTMPWALHVGQSFADVPRTSPYYRFAETLLHEGVTAGCAAGFYCPTSATTREQMAAFVLLAKEGGGYAPAPCAPPAMFADVPSTSSFCDVIEELARRGVVAGCGGGSYCPASAVSREQMAVFVLKTLDPDFVPPPCSNTPLFADVPASSPFCPWIEELARRGVVAGCGVGNYCPTLAVAREQMAVFLSATFGLALYGP